MELLFYGREEAVEVDVEEAEEVGLGFGGHPESGLYSPGVRLCGNVYGGLWEFGREVLCYRKR
jgi:hypothetical protein